jgi:hypothetical protein
MFKKNADEFSAARLAIPPGLGLVDYEDFQGKYSRPTPEGKASDGIEPRPGPRSHSRSRPVRLATRSST